MSIDQGRPFEPEARTGFYDLIDVTQQRLGSRNVYFRIDVGAFSFE